MGRSVEAVVALLGVLKSGAAYVPLDAGWPRARLQEVSKAAGLLAVLTERGLPEEAAAACAGAWAACPGDAEWEEVACEGVEDAALAGVACGAADEDVAGVRVAADNLAYIIYTSGSTGTPKGVMVTHGGLVNHCFAVAGRYGLAACDRVLQFASLTFDVAAEELFPSLLKGCGVYISPAEASASPRELVDYMTGEAITVANLPSPLWHELVSDLAASAVALPPTLRLLVTGSDRTLAERLVLWRSIAGESVRWLNAYGTTETTITSSVYEPPAGVAEPDDAPSDAQSHAASVSIGRPVANTRVYLLDRDLQPVPRGARGELYVAGRGVARGYLNDPHLTAERFVPDPFSAEPGARMYRTGDLARHLPGGELDYLGRTDNQVKVRGFRVELGEVEAALRRHEAVREAVVLTHESAAGDRLLAAYFVSRRSPPPSSGELRAFLSEHLPDQMRPSSFVALDRLPLTPGGKLDRRALPAPAFVTRGDTVRSPRTPTEEVLAGVWADVLGLPGVGIHDNFFDLGGHSLLATRIMSRVREIFQVAVPLASLFESPTIVGMAEAIGAASRDGRGVRRGPLRRSDRDAPPPLSSSQERLWFVEQLRPGTSSYHISGAIRLRGRLDVAALQASLDEIVRRHEALRTTFAEVGGRLVQLVAPAARVALPVIDASQGEGSEEQTRRLVADESRRPFDLARGPLVRALLVREGDESHVFALTMHHIVGDAWSLAVFTGEFAALYEAFGGGRESPLAEPPVQYGDYAAWQQGWVRGEEAKAQRAYWKRQLGGGLAAPRLPADHARPPQPSGRGATLKFTLTEELSASLKALGRREGVTPFMTTLAAFKTLLRRYCASEDVVVGTDVAGRDHVETEGLIGFFVNSLVLRTDLSGDPTFRELLARVRAVTLDAYAHHELPFNEVVREVRPERDAGANPLFRVMFIMQNVPPPSLTLPGLTLTPFEVHDGSSAFDLSVSVEEDERGRLGGAFRFSTDLFEPATVARLVEDYVSLLHAAAEHPDARLSALDVVRRGWRERVGPAGGPRGKFERLAATRPRAVSVSRGGLVSASYLETGARLPLVLRPAAADVDLVAWAGANRELVEERLHTHGAILFRGFRLDSLSRFESFAAATSGRLTAYGERSSPRTGLGGHVYTSTDHPADQHILLHNEQSYTLAWPMKLWFFCRRPAARGGRTPVADSRNVARRLAGAGEALARRGVMYVRNYGDGLGLPWQEVFQTSERREVEEHCRRASIEVEWKDRGRLRTRQVRPAVRRHPRTGEFVWFNHALFFHVSSLPERAARESIIAGFGEEDLPYNTYYGDGAPIEPEVLDQIREAYRRETVGFDWRRGDVLMVDNMLVAHGREPFEGEREIAVVMGDPVSVER
jgi:amino acid adenylation domain-containing protein